MDLRRRQFLNLVAGTPIAAAIASTVPARIATPRPKPISFNPELVDPDLAQRILSAVAAEAVVAVPRHLNIGKHIARNFEPISAAAGAVVNIPVPPILFTRGFGPPAKQILGRLGNARIVLNRHMEATIAIPDVTRVLTNPEMLRTYVEPAALAFAESIEQSLVALFPKFGRAIILCNPLDNAEQCIDLAETHLFRARVPCALEKHVVTDTDSYSQLRQCLRFTETDTGTGRIKGMIVNRSPFANKAGLAFARDAMALVVRFPVPENLDAVVQDGHPLRTYVNTQDFGLRVSMGHHPTALMQTFTFEFVYGVGVVRKNWGVQLKPYTV